MNTFYNLLVNAFEQSEEHGLEATERFKRMSQDLGPLAIAGELAELNENITSLTDLADLAPTLDAIAASVESLDRAYTLGQRPADDPPPIGEVAMERGMHVEDLMQEIADGHYPDRWNLEGDADLPTDPTKAGHLAYLTAQANRQDADLQIGRIELDAVKDLVNTQMSMINALTAENWRMKSRLGLLTEHDPDEDPGRETTSYIESGGVLDSIQANYESMHADLTALQERIRRLDETAELDAAKLRAEEIEEVIKHKRDFSDKLNQVSMEETQDLLAELGEEDSISDMDDQAELPF
jgi:hypothetical protein